MTTLAQQPGKAFSTKPPAGSMLARRPYLFMLPTAVLLLTFAYYPFLTAFFRSLFEWDGAHHTRFVGLGNFKRLILTDAEFHRSLVVCGIFLAANLIKLVTISWPVFPFWREAPTIATDPGWRKASKLMPTARPFVLQAVSFQLSAISLKKKKQDGRQDRRPNPSPLQPQLLLQAES